MLALMYNGDNFNFPVYIIKRVVNLKSEPLHQATTYEEKFFFIQFRAFDYQSGNTNELGIKSIT